MLKISKNAEKAIEMLNSNGYEAYAVGGCVRDLIMGKEANDFDITTSAFPEETKKVFEKERTIETGIKHGTLTVLINGEPLEITTYRIDGEYLDNRRPESVSFTRNLENDLSRRDFTMNALVYNPAHGVLDYFGGIDDIKNGIIRAIGDPEKRFREDALRILRAIRFSSTLGFKIEESTKRAMVNCKHLLHNISGERIAVEINKFVLGKNVKSAILENCEILGELVPEFAKMQGFDQRNKWHIYDILEHTAVAVENTPLDLSLRLSMLFHDTGKVHTFFTDEKGVGHFYGHGEKSAEIARNYLNKYKYDNYTKGRVIWLVENHDVPTEERELIVKRRLSKMGKERFLELLKIQRADNLAQNPDLVDIEHFARLEKMVDSLSEQCVSLSSLDVNGNDLVNIGFEGKSIGKTLNTLLEEVIENKLPNEKSALLERAHKLK